MSSLGLMYFGKGNHKLGTEILTFGITAGVSCPGAHECKTIVDENGKLKTFDETRHKCLAARMEALRPNVLASHKKHEQLIQELEFTQLIDRFILSINFHGSLATKYIRWNWSGDYFSTKYRDAVFAVAKEFDHLVHYSYSKSLHLFQGIKRPENFRLTASHGGKFQHLLEMYPEDFPRSAQVVKDKDEAELKGLPVDQDDSLAYGPIDQHFGLLLKKGTGLKKLVAA